MLRSITSLHKTKYLLVPHFKYRQILVPKNPKPHEVAESEEKELEDSWKDKISSYEDYNDIQKQFEKNNKEIIEHNKDKFGVWYGWIP